MPNSEPVLWKDESNLHFLGSFQELANQLLCLIVSENCEKLPSGKALRSAFDEPPGCEKGGTSK
jgi:hypothetical protein